MGRGLSVLELIQAFERATGRKVPYRMGDRRAGDIEQIWADTSYGEQELQWHAEMCIRDRNYPFGYCTLDKTTRTLPL